MTWTQKRLVLVVPMKSSEFNQQKPLLTTVRLVSLFVLFVTILYWQTVWSMIAIWNRSDTYAHGYLIVPISLWLVWRQRDVLANCVPTPNFWVQLLIVPSGIIWFLAYLTDVLVLQQLAFVSIIIVGIWSILGHRIAWQMVFPLCYLFLAVPMGEDLVEPMMEFTATSTVWLIKLTGIPVYREGLYFTLPSGNWSVVEACSGVRYIIASVTLGLLYAQLTYASIGKKVLFVVASLVVPIVANTARAYLIVMLGHLSDMTIATGVDHLIYGWLFFGVVILVLFWVGSFWSDHDLLTPISGTASSIGNSAKHTQLAIIVTLSATAIAAFWPILGVTTDNSEPSYVAAELAIPEAGNGWEISLERNWDWQPYDRGADYKITQFYRYEDKTVALYLQQYLGGKQGAELISGRANQFVHEDQSWYISSTGRKVVKLSAEKQEVRQVELGDGDRQLKLWYWYRIGDKYTASQYLAKLYEAIQVTLSGRRDATLVIVATKLEEGENAAVESDEVLQNYISDALDGIEMVLDAGLLVEKP